ncbi:MAG TPA: helix-turn-helix domain-containing protein [Saprospiraceae bacterium]|nr:helix-turn-helix domain-containing protein [Saprospiraceae bacterium]
MSRKFKYSPEIKVKACEEYLSGNYSILDLCNRYDISYKKGTCSIYKWLSIYMESGAKGFFYNTQKNKQYSKELKLQAVEDYLSGKGSLRDISAKYRIKDSRSLRSWISLYNANKELKDYNPKREVYMAEARRKTTIEERKEIVEHCIDHERNYKETASLYDVSYSQVYSWVKKYDANGEAALIDKRGHHKTDDEVDELERLRRENKRLKRHLAEQDRLTELLKKAKEFEGM